MPVLKIYEKDTDKEPYVVYSGAIWVWQKGIKKLTLWIQGVQFDYQCEKLIDNCNSTVFYAYGEIVPPEEQPEEVINF